jgi:hypothetical protein
MASPIEILARDIGRVISPELPRDLGTFDQHLDFILPKIVQYSEDIREGEHWLGKRWREVRDDEGFHEVLLHIFNPGGEYLISIDGNLMKGSWKPLQQDNSLIIEIGGRSELFDLQFLNGDFFVLAKHGDQARKGQRRYFLLAYEPITYGKHGDLDWRNLMERLFNIWRENSLSLGAWFAFVVVVGIILWMSLK